MSLPARNPRLLSLEQLSTLIGTGDVDTVVVAFTDMQGRLQGKRLHAAYFLDVVVEQGTEGCNYLLGVDVDMNTVDGYAMTSWEKGYGDMEFVLDFDTIRAAAAPAGDRDDPVRPGAGRPRAGRAVAAHDPEAPARQRPPTPGYVALAGTELEFILFDDTYESAWDAGYRDLTPSNQYNVDYSILGTTRVEPLLRDIRNTMYAAGHERRGRQGRVQLRAARDRLPLRRGAGDRRQPRGLQDRGQGDRRRSTARR